MALPAFTCAALLDEHDPETAGEAPAPFRWDGSGRVGAPRDEGRAEHRPLMKRLGIKGLLDAHSHWFPENVERKIWSYFDRHYWAVTYRAPPAERLERMRQNGVQRFAVLNYAHRPGMAAWLNDWTAEFSAGLAEAIPCGTFYPEPEAERYVRRAIEEYGFRGFKLHLRVAEMDPTDPLLAPAFEQVAAAGLPVVLHCGSAPDAGRFTAPRYVNALLQLFPRLKVVVAHMGALEYGEYLGLAESHPNVYLDTTMIFVSQPALARYPEPLLRRLEKIADKVLYGSDFPNIPYPLPQAVGGVLALPFSTAAKGRILAENAAALFGTA
ncbi:MAG: amidohydrolase family protein [bacterium]